MQGISSLVQSLFDCISQYMRYGQVKIENQETAAIIQDKEDLKKAGNIAEEIIEIARKYESLMSGKDRRKLKRLIKRFNKAD